MSNAETQNQLKIAFSAYFELLQKEDEIQKQLDELESKRKELEELRERNVHPVIMNIMHQMDIRSIQVRGHSFSIRTLQKGAPRRKPYNDSLVQQVLKKHLSGQDNVLRNVLTELAQLRTPPPEAGATVEPELVEQLVRRPLPKPKD